MTDEAKRLVAALRNSYGYSERRDNDAADMIEKLSADLESNERQYCRDAFETIVAEGVKLEAERDKWKHRCKSAEQDIETLLMEGAAGCDFCAYFGTCSRSEIQGTYCKPRWRGLSDEKNRKDERE